MSVKRALEDEGTSSDNPRPAVFSNPAYTRYLFELVTEGRVNELQGEKLVDFKLRDETGDTLMHRAVKKWLLSGTANTELITYLISQDPSLLEETNSSGQTALCYVCSQCNSVVSLDVISYLLDICSSAAVNMADNQEVTALHYFMSSEDRLLRCSHQYRTLTSAPQAVKENKDILSLAKVFLEKGAKVNAEDHRGSNVLGYMLNIVSRYSSRNRRIVDFLLNNGAIVNAKTLKAINSKDFFNYLLKNIDLNAKDENNWTSLHHLLMNDRSFNNVLCREWKVKLLLENGAQLEEGVSGIDLAREQGCSFDLITFLMPHFPGYDVNTKDASGATLLLQYGTSAAQNIEILLGLGADLKAKDNKGNTIIHNIMTEFSEPALFRKLVDLGAEPLVCNDAGDNVFQFICRCCMQRDMPRYLYDWQPLFQYFLNLPQFSATPLDELNKTIITPLLKYFCSQFHDEFKSRVLQLLFNIVYRLQENIGMLTIETPIPAMCNFQFSNCVLDPIAHLIATIDSSDFNHDVEEFIHFMLSFGFSVEDTNNMSVSSLTILLMLYGGHKLDLVVELFNNGVSMECSVLEFTHIPYCSEETMEMIQTTKTCFFMPDALLVTYIKDLGGIVDELELIAHCWFPPIFLVYFLPKFSSLESFKYWFKKLSVYGNLLCGTEVFLVGKTLLYAAIEDYNNEPMPADPEFREMCNQMISTLSVKTPASLREMSKYELRLQLAKLANANGSTLPNMIEKCVPPTLRFLVNHVS